MMFPHIDSQMIPVASFFQADCAWCWYAKNPSTPFPENWSSSICDQHQDWQLTRLAERRASRQPVQEVNFILVGDVVSVKTQRAPRPFRYREPSRCYPSNWLTVAAVMRRIAGYRCQRCHKSGVSLTVHHKGVDYIGKKGNRHDKHDSRQENLAVLCERCHEIEERKEEYAERNRRRKVEWRHTNPDYYNRYGLVKIE